MAHATPDRRLRRTRLFNYKVLLIELFISRIWSSIYQVVFKTIKHSIESRLVISSFLVIVVEVEIYAFLLRNDFSGTGLFFCVVPFF